MKNKTILALLVIPLMIALAACSSIKLPGTTSAQAASNTQNQRGNFDPSKMPVEQKLGIGTLKLQDTPNAITADEAKNLLPLWKAVKSLGASNTSSADEVTALYKQIEDTMTPAQVDAIKTMTWTQQDMTALFQKYGIQTGQGGFANLTPDQRATRVAQFQQNNGNRSGGGGGGGVFVGGGGFPGGGFAGGGNGQNGAQQQRTPAPGNSGRRAGGLNMLLADPIIKMLQTLSGA